MVFVKNANISQSIYAKLSKNKEMVMIFQNYNKSIDLITESSFSSNIMLLSSSNFMENKSLALGG